MLHLSTADPVTQRHTDHQWSPEDKSKLSETRLDVDPTLASLYMQSQQAEGVFSSVSNQIWCGHRAQRGPRRRRCLSGKSHLCLALPIDTRLTIGDRT